MMNKQTLHQMILWKANPTREEVIREHSSCSLFCKLATCSAVVNKNHHQGAGN